MGEAAVALEMSPTVMTRPNLRLVGRNDTELQGNLGGLAIVEALHPEVPQLSAVEASDMPHFRSIIEKAQARGQEIAKLKQAANTDLLNDDREEDIPDSVDYMSTAREVVGIKRKYGPESPEYQDARQGLWYNQARKLREAIRRQAYEVYESLPQKRDKYGVLRANGFSVEEYHERGISPLDPSEEMRRQVNDLARLHVNNALLDGEEAVTTVGIWLCPQWALDLAKNHPEMAYRLGDYVTSIEKGMVVADKINPETGTIEHEQIGVSAKYYNREVVSRAYQKIGALKAGQVLEREAVHAAQPIIEGEVGAIDMVKILDAEASEFHGKEIFMGEDLEPGQTKDYDRVLAEADDRRKEQMEMTDHLTEYVEGLAEQGIDSKSGRKIIDDHIQDMLLEIALRDPDQAEIMFDDKTARGLREVQLLKAQNKHQEAAAKFTQVKEEAPPVGGCTGGSCGLERVDMTSAKGLRIKEQLNVQEGEEVLHDTERPCPECGEMEVHYAFTANTVKKYCDNCGTKDFGETPVTKTSESFEADEE